MTPGNRQPGNGQVFLPVPRAALSPRPTIFPRSQCTQRRVADQRQPGTGAPPHTLVCAWNTNRAHGHRLGYPTPRRGPNTQTRGDTLASLVSCTKIGAGGAAIAVRHVRLSTWHMITSLTPRLASAWSAALARTVFLTLHDSSDGCVAQRLPPPRL